ncbi:MAG: dipeptide/oligopeptide/nickel ABC transporter ATP-binding protein [Rhizobiales bacterium PAR1]|nr:MAG: dipeptide/oligopeptide/nickel ABC transporter ATP-binding protein [Rhizobiales bacterium PAR1]
MHPAAHPHPDELKALAEKSRAVKLLPNADRGGPATPLLSVTGLTKHFPLARGAVVRAVDGVDFTVKKGETLGVVGESGCGKSTTARLIMQLLDQDAGEMLFDGELVGGLELPLKEYRRQAQMVFQDSYASLNPRMTIEASVAFGPQVHGLSKNNAITRARDLLAKVGLDPARFAGRYPHELSGGQRQRVNIARALALSPRLLILDESVSALDKSVEAQVLNLLLDLREAFDLTYVFISHDLNVVRFMSDRVMVMYLGEIVEIGPVETLYAAPAHPYTRALLAAMPSMDPDRRTEEAPLAGDPPNPINPPPGCRFHPRCPFAEALCCAVRPELSPVGEDGRQVACHINTPGARHSKAPPALEIIP